MPQETTTTAMDDDSAMDDETPELLALVINFHFDNCIQVWDSESGETRICCCFGGDEVDEDSLLP